MSDKTKARIPAGMRDILPEQMIRRQYVINTVQTVFEEFGFEPLQTSAIEMADTLLGKYGPDAERLIYRAWYGDQPDGEFALRYDLSVPLCRVMAMYPDLSRPFKRYQIAPVWRADRPQKGRYREFFQCDADIVGSESMTADAEIVALAYQLLSRLGFSGFKISINNRKLIDGIGQFAGVPEDLQAGLYRSIDKLDKIGIEGVRQELLMVGVPRDIMEPLQRIARLLLQEKLSFADMPFAMIGKPEEGGEGLDPGLVDLVLQPMQRLVTAALKQGRVSEKLQAETRMLVFDLAEEMRQYYRRESVIIPTEVVNKLLDLLQLSGEPRQMITELTSLMTSIPSAEEGLDELNRLFDALDAFGVPPEAYQLNFAMVRGLEYYTGPIFEITVEKPKAMPSITGGGRFDELIGMFAENSLPAVGISFGIERIIDAMTELEMFPPTLRTTTALVLVTSFDEKLSTASLTLAAELRASGINTSVYYDPRDRLGSQIGYASALGIPFVAILGPDELAQGAVTVRKLGKTRQDSEERRVDRAELARTLQAW